MTVPARRRTAQLRLVIAAVALAAIWLVMLLFGRGAFDLAVYKALYVGGNPTLVAIARSLTALGEPTILIAAGVGVLLWLWYAGRARLGLILFLIAMTGRGLSELQKYWIARPRPDLDQHLVVVQTSSFPSGHANSSMIFYTTMALALAAGTKWYRVAVIGAVFLSLLVGASRVMLGVHWPSDVIGGWSLGLLWVLITLRPAERLFVPDTRERSKQL